MYHIEPGVPSHKRIHARSMDSRNGPGRGWVKQLHAAIGYDIPPGWRLCGENLYAAHSIWYHGLESYFYLFNVFDEKDNCLPWDDVKLVATLLGLCTVPEIYRGPFNEKVIRDSVKESLLLTYEVPKDHVPVDEPIPTNGEGYVIRTTDGFPASEFSTHVAKYVRPGHIQTDSHWMDLPVLPNRLIQ
jgi:hypothetical protein